MPFLTLLTVTPYYVRPFLLLVAVCIPRLLKAVLAIEDIKKSAIIETKSAMDRTSEVTGKRPDLMSQLLAIVQEKGEKVNYSHREITSDMWVGMYVPDAAMYRRCTNNLAAWPARTAHPSPCAVSSTF